jgi:4-aminobutyrate aminotransferase-like enzyme
MTTGGSLPKILTAIPGPKSRQLSRQLHRYECRNITHIAPRWPIFWKRASGANVWDVDGNRYVDLTAAFGVAGIGHSNPRVVAALHRQAQQLLHAMGDVHPNAVKLTLARQLVELTFRRWNAGNARVIFANSGSESVEAALKTAVIATKRAGLIAFTGAYHGLTLGALDATSGQQFRDPFLRQLGHFTTHVPFGTVPALRDPARYAAVIVEPILGRGGVVVPPDDFLPGLRRFCDRHGILLIADEIYTGFGRTGRWFACEHWNTTPDIICVGKSLAGGMPLAACIGRAAVMDRWPLGGEAIHTSTFLGHPVSCAAALASIAEMKRLRVVERAAELGEYVAAKLRPLGPVRGRGLMLGLPVRASAHMPVRLLQRGIIALQENGVLGITPPLTITRRQLDFGIETIAHTLKSR